MPGVPPVAAGTLKEPDQVRVCPDTLGLAVVAPVLEPATYEKPAGSVSVMLVSVWATAPGLLMVTVYPSAVLASTSESSAVLVRLTGVPPTGENTVRLAMVVEPVAATAAGQLSAMPLSMSSAQRQVSGSCVLVPTALHTWENPDSM